MLQRFVNWLALTRAEQRVLMFLTGTLIVGAGIRLYQETFPTEPRFDYRSIDSSFAVFRESLAVDSARQKLPASGRAIDINAATKEELMSLPGIGATIAERIISFREKEGEFASVEDLQKVKGISKKKLEKLKPHITVQ